MQKKAGMRKKSDEKQGINKANSKKVDRESKHINNYIKYKQSKQNNQCRDYRIRF